MMRGVEARKKQEGRAGWSGKAKQSFAGRIPKRRACERILPTVVPDIRRGDSRDGKRGRGG